MPVDQLLRRVDAEEQARGPLEYARSVVEYCSHVALRVEARRPDHLGDREFHTLTYDMMLAWEAPDEETDAVFQVRIQIGCLPPPVVRTNRHVILTREIPIKIQCWVFFPTMQKTAFSVLRGDDADDDDSGSIFYSSPTQMAIQVSGLFLLCFFPFHRSDHPLVSVA